MAGHSKWKNIQHRKNAQDARRGKQFTKLIRELTIAAKIGGPDPESNPRLRTARAKALISNMTRDTIDRAIKRGAGGLEDNDLEEIRYEGYGPGGVAIMVDCMTDNRNRTVGEVRHLFAKFGGNLGTDGSVSYLFAKRGLMTFAPGSDENRIMEAALEAGAEDVVTHTDGSVDVLTDPEQFETVRAMLATAGLAPEQAEVTLLAATDVTLADAETAEKMVKLMDALEDLDDVQNVYSNADIPEELLAGL